MKEDAPELVVNWRGPVHLAVSTLLEIVEVDDVSVTIATAPLSRDPETLRALRHITAEVDGANCIGGHQDARRVSTPDYRDSLLLAAHAAKVHLAGWDETLFAYLLVDGGYWNAFEDDGDALRLSTALEMDILHRVVGGERVEIVAPGYHVQYPRDRSVDINEAVRSAVVLSAASIERKRRVSMRHSPNLGADRGAFAGF